MAGWPIAMPAAPMVTPASGAPAISKRDCSTDIVVPAEDFCAIGSFNSYALFWVNNIG
jgi:hypothetical protein